MAGRPRAPGRRPLGPDLAPWEATLVGDSAMGRAGLRTQSLGTPGLAHAARGAGAPFLALRAMRKSIQRVPAARRASQRGGRPARSRCWPLRPILSVCRDPVIFAFVRAPERSAGASPGASAVAMLGHGWTSLSRPPAAGGPCPAQFGEHAGVVAAPGCRAGLRPSRRRSLLFG